MTAETLSVSRAIRASAHKLYGAFLDPEAVASWRPPKGMTAIVHFFEGREGGGYRMSFDYVGANHEVRGKTSEHADVFRGRFTTLVPDRHIVEEIVFESDDPAFAGTMTLTTSFEPVAEGTKVTVAIKNAPKGIKPADHEAGARSSLENLAAFAE